MLYVCVRGVMDVVVCVKYVLLKNIRWKITGRIIMSNQEKSTSGQTHVGNT